jgi:hypothetical protein
MNDLNAGLPQVLEDGTNTYTYGIDRISQTTETDTEYFLGDALGSVRQLTDSTGAISLDRNYDPFGNLEAEAGSGIFGYLAQVESIVSTTVFRCYNFHRGVTWL